MQAAQNLRISIHAPRTGSDPFPKILSPSTEISIHAPRTGSDEHGHKTADGQPISIHAPRTGSDRAALRFLHIGGISIHAPRTGSDRTPRKSTSFSATFQSTLPARGATERSKNANWLASAFQSTLPARGATFLPSFYPFLLEFQSTLPARGATDTLLADADVEEISIHAPRTGSDAKRHLFPSCREPISIHAPRTGSDERPACTRKSGAYFNPRSPHGERRHSVHRQAGKQQDFNPRSPHGERLDPLTNVAISCDFNPRSPHGERRIFVQIQRSFWTFQSTLPARGATLTKFAALFRRRISIHAPRTGSDWSGRDGLPAGEDFNPRSPHGERLASTTYARRSKRFQSTLPARGATTAKSRLCTASTISIHAPRTGSDPLCGIHSPAKHTFQSTLPARGATQIKAWWLSLASHFNPRSPHGERRNVSARRDHCNQFQSTLPARGATRRVRG